MVRRFRERGEGNVGCILWAVLLAVGVLIAWKVVPIKIKNAELYDFMVQQAQLAQHSSSDELAKRILYKAKELDLSVTEKNVVIQKGRERIRMEVKYTVTLDFPFYSYDWDIDHQVDRPIFIF
jgi:hypothetical protein